MLERWKLFALILCQQFSTFTASLAGDAAPQTLSKAIYNHDDVLTPKSFAIWPNGSVPFYINDSHFDQEQQLQIMKVLSDFAFKTCLKFKPLLTPPDSQHALVFQNPDGLKRCGFVDSGHSRSEPHYVTLGYKCLSSPNIDMMLMRALGFPFEHNRVIRDLYIDVQHENTQSGYNHLFTKDMKLPLELRNLPYDVNSVLHFGEREFSKNGHRTIIIKNPNTKQKRHSLTNLDLRRIEIVYGPECLKREREAKLAACLPYDAQPYPRTRRKRDAPEPSSVGPSQSLRVNPDITPPPTLVPAAEAGGLPEELSTRLKELGIEEQVQAIVDKVHQLSAKALTDARENYCNKTEKAQDIGASRRVTLLDILKVVASYAESMVNHAVQNLTMFCEAADPVAFYQRAWCQFDNPRCVQTYFKSTHLWHKGSTQYRPAIIQSTKNWSRKGNQYMRSQNDTDDDSATASPATASPLASAKVRRKREAVSEITRTTDINDGVVTPRYRVVHSRATARSRKPFTGEPREMHKRQDSDEDDSDEGIRVTALHFESDDEAKRDDDWEQDRIKTKKTTMRHAKKSKAKSHKVKVIEYAPLSDENEDKDVQHKWKNDKELVPLKMENPLGTSEEDSKYVNVIHSKPKKVNRNNNMEKKKVHLPKTVNLSKMNEEFYDARRWRDGVVRYIISEQGEKYDLDDMRRRLDEVNQILRQKTCVRIQEITENEAPKYEDYLVLDTSPDYVTGKVGGRQNFGSIELFVGGQHRQHAAMVVMAMLGFYFEVSRHDRDKYIVVHPRNIRPDKLHHFEMLREDATLAVPYDYDSATHPNWQFWRKLGKTGIATVATYKEMDPDGKIMKILGQHPRLLSEIDIVKINSVYGAKCLGGKGAKRSATKRDRSQTFI